MALPASLEAYTSRHKDTVLFRHADLGPLRNVIIAGAGFLLFVMWFTFIYGTSRGLLGTELAGQWLVMTGGLMASMWVGQKLHHKRLEAERAWKDLVQSTEGEHYRFEQRQIHGAIELAVYQERGQIDCFGRVDRLRVDSQQVRRRSFPLDQAQQAAQTVLDWKAEYRDHTLESQRAQRLIQEAQETVGLIQSMQEKQQQR